MSQSIEIERPRIILVACEPAFGDAMRQFASSHAVILDCFETLPAADIISRYQAAIFVCDLLTMPNIAMDAYISTAFSHIPTLLVSDLTRKPTPLEIKRWRVRSFMLRDYGHEPIFFTALGMISSAPLPAWVS